MPERIVMFRPASPSDRSATDPLGDAVAHDLLVMRCCEVVIGNSPGSLLTTTFAGLTLAAVMARVVDHWLVGAWLVLLSLSLTFRYWLYVQWRRDGGARAGAEACLRFRRRYRHAANSSALLWGSTSLLVIAQGDVAYREFVTMLLVGVGAVAMTTLAIDRACVRTFLAAVLAPLALRYLVQPELMNQVQGVFVLFYLLFAVGNAERVRLGLIENLRLEVRIQEREKRLDQAQQVAKLGSFEWDPQRDVMRWSDEHFRLWGLSPGEREPDRKLFLERVHPEDRQALEHCMDWALRQGRPYECVHRLVWPDRPEQHIQARIEPVLDRHGKVLRLVGTVQNITGQRQAEARMRNLAFYDVLTGLPNRHLLLERLQAALQRHNRDGGCGALIFIDLDNFKYLNDTHGHDRGDELLRLVARRVLAAVRRTDTVARLGGDEFVVMLEDLEGAAASAEQQSVMVGEEIRGAIMAPYMLAGREFHSSCSIGVALFRGGEAGAEDVMKRADLAMYQAKGAGRNAVCLFTHELEARAGARSAMEADLRSALQASQFLLHLQGQVDGEGRCTGAEALLRWQHPVRGAVSPAQMIPVAEESGLILPVGHWVLVTACQHLVRWAADPRLEPLTLAVNVSGRQFRQPQFVAEVLEVLRETGANPRRLKIELTESLLLTDLEETIRKMAALRREGVGFALDDFGTGYSSLSYLQRLPLELLKIDQVFVRDVLTNPNNAAIVRMVLNLGHTFGLEVIAEGVESEGQRDFLAASGCHGFQGFLFGRPMPVHEFEQRARDAGSGPGSRPRDRDGPGPRGHTLLPALS